MSFEHHPEMYKDENNDEDRHKIPGPYSAAEEQNDERQCATDEHHPHHSRILFSVMVVHSWQLHVIDGLF